MSQEKRTLRKAAQQFRDSLFQLREEFREARQNKHIDEEEAAELKKDFLATVVDGALLIGASQEAVKELRATLEKLWTP